MVVVVCTLDNGPYLFAHRAVTTGDDGDDACAGGQESFADRVQHVKDILKKEHEHHGQVGAGALVHSAAASAALFWPAPHHRPSWPAPLCPVSLCSQGKVMWLHVEGRGRRMTAGHDVEHTPDLSGKEAVRSVDYSLFG